MLWRYFAIELYITICRMQILRHFFSETAPSDLSTCRIFPRSDRSFERGEAGTSAQSVYSLIGNEQMFQEHEQLDWKKSLRRVPFRGEVTIFTNSFGALLMTHLPCLD